MERSEEAIAEVLALESEVFRRDWEAHRRYEEILEQLARRSHLSAEEELEKKKIQKLKLAGKDRMVRMILSYRKRNPDSACVAELEGERRS